jgi:hypothetical protein
MKKATRRAYVPERDPESTTEPDPSTWSSQAMYAAVLASVANWSFGRS